MSSRHRSRSPVRDRRSLSSEHDEGRRGRRDGKDKGAKSLPHDAEPLTDGDYFLKNAEFRTWLKEEKDKVSFGPTVPHAARSFFDELSGEKARSYFQKFVKAWNRGKLPKSYYAGINSIRPAASQTAYRWSFATKRTREEQAALDAACNAVHAATRISDPDTPAAQDSHSMPNRVLGPTLPSASDRIFMHEAREEGRAADRSYQRKRAREEDKERIEDLVGPKERGREAMLEKKKMRREADKAAHDAKDDVLGEYDDRTLMGGGDSFQARIAQRDAARRRFEEKRSSGKEEKGAAMRERQEAIRAKDRATMDMFKQMAKERFGG